MIPPAVDAIIRSRSHVAFYRYFIAAVDGAQTAEQYRVLIKLLREHEVLDFLVSHARSLSPLADALLQGLCEKVLSETGAKVSAEYLVLPPLFRLLGWRTSRAGSLEAVRGSLLGELSVAGNDSRRRFRVCLLLLLLDGLLDGPEPALAGLVDRVVESPTWVPPQIGSKLQLLGWYDPSYVGLVRHAANRISSLALDELGGIATVLGVLEVLGFSKIASRRWNELLYRELVLPLMKQSLARGRDNLALHLEQTIFQSYLPQTETIEHFMECTSQWLRDMNSAGRRLRLPARETIGAAADPRCPRVGLLLFANGSLAHVEGLMTLFEGLGQLQARPFDPVVYVFLGRDDGLRGRLGRLGVSVVFLDEQVPAGRADWVARLEWLRGNVREQGLAALAYVSVPVTMAFAFGMRVAPVQIWWAMKHHALELEDIDGYMTGGSMQESRRRIGNRDWHTAPGAVAGLRLPGIDSSAALTREQFGSDTVVLGSIVRPEKLHNEEFLATLARILHGSSNAVFLWFGHYQPPELVARMRQLGILEQCLFQGWVDTKVFARVLDVHLDPFPFPAGITMLQTMAVGVPGVSMLTDESRQNGIIGMLGGLLDGNLGSASLQRQVREAMSDELGDSLFFCARSTAEYESFARRLIDDRELRVRAGRAAARLLRGLNDPRRMAEMFGSNLREIIEETTVRRRQTGDAARAPEMVVSR